MRTKKKKKKNYQKGMKRGAQTMEWLESEKSWKYCKTDLVYGTVWQDESPQEAEIVTKITHVVNPKWQLLNAQLFALPPKFREKANEQMLRMFILITTLNKKQTSIQRLKKTKNDNAPNNIKKQRNDLFHLLPVANRQLELLSEIVDKLTLAHCNEGLPFFWQNNHSQPFAITIPALTKNDEIGNHFTLAHVVHACKLASNLENVNAHYIADLFEQKLAPGEMFHVVQTTDQFDLDAWNKLGLQAVNVAKKFYLFCKCSQCRTVPVSFDNYQLHHDAKPQHERAFHFTINNNVDSHYSVPYEIVAMFTLLEIFCDALAVLVYQYFYY